MLLLNCYHQQIFPNYVCRVMRMINQLGKFLPNCAEVTHPMTALVSPKSSWIWGSDQINAFNNVKEELTKNPKVLALYNPTAETRFSADTSSYGIGGVFLQKVDTSSICFSLNVVSRIVLRQIRKPLPLSVCVKNSLCIY